MTKAELLSGSAAPTPNPAVTNGKRYMTRAEAAKYITDNWFPHSPKTLAKLAVIGGGPVFRKAGRVPIYMPSDCDDYARSKISQPVCSTAELAKVSAAQLRADHPQHQALASASGQPLVQRRGQ